MSELWGDFFFACLLLATDFLFLLAERFLEVVERRCPGGRLLCLRAKTIIPPDPSCFWSALTNFPTRPNMSEAMLLVAVLR